MAYLFHFFPDLTFWGHWRAEYSILFASIVAVVLVVLLLRFTPGRQSAAFREDYGRSVSNLSISERSLTRKRSLSFDAFSSWRPASSARQRGPSFDFGFVPTPRGSETIVHNHHKVRDRILTPRHKVSPNDPGPHVTPNKYHGPRIQSIEFDTWTPPPSWSETARQLLPTGVPTLQRRLQLCMAKDSVLVCLIPSEKQKNKFETELSLSIDVLSVHPKPPVGGGVLELYEKDSPLTDWMEHTFASAREASQFQLDLQALQAFGPQIYHMYQALEIVHKGSMAYDGVESVLHDAVYATIDRGPTGIAWDDVMRSLGVHFPLMRWRLEQLWWNEMSGIQGTPRNDDGNSDTDDSLGLVHDYQKKRLLLGLVDFFRLFVPELSSGSAPETRPTDERFERLLRWRKRVARASLLVQSYVSVKVIANSGWKVNLPIPTGYWKKRLAYDQKMDNMIRDTTVENEIYEPTVSRDLHCIVRGKRRSTNEEIHRFADSKGQAFMLVDAHLFRFHPTTAGRSDFDFSQDPVEFLPSLRAVLKDNPLSEFFVFTVWLKDDTVAVYLFVRTIPRGIDESFDCAWQNFQISDASTRSRKLDCILGVAIGPRGMTILAMLCWKFISVLLRFLARRTYVPQRDASTSENFPLGSLGLSLLGDLCHFGGSLLSNSGDPTNYVATTLFLGSGHGMSLRSYLLKYIFQCKEIFDFTIKISSEEAHGLPERALGTVRHVRLSETLETLIIQASVQPPQQGVGWRGLLTGQSTDDCVSSIASHFVESRQRPWASVIATADPIEKAVNQIIELLDDIRTPSRHTTLQNASTILHREGRWVVRNLRCPPSAEKALQERIDLRQVPVLEMVRRRDIRRFYIASGLDVKTAAVRIVDTVAWRGLMFPIDTRSCRIELQNGQFFQQGRDLTGHPVFYFRAMCRGPWRGDEDALISSVLHRFDTSLSRLISSNSNVRCTFIVVMGRPVETVPPTSSEDMNQTPISVETSVEHSTGTSEELESDQDIANAKAQGINSRISPSESNEVHANARVLHRLIDILLCHYPERLHRALIVTKNMSKVDLTTRHVSFARHLKGHGIRDRVQIIRKYEDLESFIHRSELVNFVGGKAAVDNSAFDSA